MRAASASRAASRTLRSSLRPSLRRYCTETDAILMAAPPRMRVVDLHRPDALNALNSEMVATLLAVRAHASKPAPALATGQFSVLPTCP